MDKRGYCLAPRCALEAVPKGRFGPILELTEDDADCTSLLANFSQEYLNPLLF